jgi:hypothetical protein
MVGTEWAGEVGSYAACPVCIQMMYLGDDREN